MSTNFSKTIENGIEQLVKNTCLNFINALNNRGALSCSFEEATDILNTCSSVSTSSLNREKCKSRPKKPSIVLPFCGTVSEGLCEGVRYNHGLHTQCTNDPIINNKYCKTCDKNAKTNEKGVPTFGNIYDRKLAGSNYIDPTGKKTICYANVAKKLGIDLDEAVRVACECGLTIPADQLVEVKKRRGRPPKNKQSIKEEGSGRKKRSLPKFVVRKEPEDIAASNLMDSSDSDEEVNVTLEETTVIDGVKYYITTSGGAGGLIMSYPEGEVVGHLIDGKLEKVDL